MIVMPSLSSASVGYDPEELPQEKPYRIANTERLSREPLQYRVADNTPSHRYSPLSVDHSKPKKLTGLFSPLLSLRWPSRTDLEFTCTHLVEFFSVGKRIWSTPV